MISTQAEIQARWSAYAAAVASGNYDVVDSIGEQAVRAAPALTYVLNRFVGATPMPIGHCTPARSSAETFVAIAHSEQLPDVASPAPRLNGCHNRAAFKTELVVQDGWEPMGVTRLPQMKTTPFRMRSDCSYANETDLGRADKGCTGCKWRTS